MAIPWITMPLAVGALVVLHPLFLSAQSPTAQITGIVSDTSGSVVPGVTVELVNTATGVATATTTNTVGNYVFPFLSPGEYRILARKEGFRPVSRSGVGISVNQVARIDFTLEVGAVNETIDVVASAPAVESETASLGTVVDNRSLLNMPLNTRNPLRLALLVPGLVPSRGFGDAFNTANRIMINGGRGNLNEIMVDGVTNSIPSAQQFLATAVFPSPDAIEEFKVQTNSYSAEYGRTGGGVINMVMKSGSNELHGSVYEFLRNSKLDANNFFSNRAGQPLQSFQRNQFGLAAGGRIVRDKAFFFFNYEGLRQRTPRVLTATVPAEAERRGDFSRSTQPVGAACSTVTIYDPLTTRPNPAGAGFVRTPFANSIIPRSRFDRAGSGFIEYFPPANQPGAPCSGINNFFAAGKRRSDVNQVDSRLDWAPTGKDRVFLGLSWRDVYNLDQNLYGTLGDTAEAINGDKVPGKGIRLDYTRIQTPRLILNLRQGVSRMERSVPPSTVTADFRPSDVGFPQPLADQMRRPYAFPRLTFTGYGGMGNAGGYAYAFLSYTTYSWNASATWVAGRHTLKFGTDTRVNQVYEDTGFATHGVFSFGRNFTQGPDPNVARADRGNALATMLLGHGGGSVQLLPGTLTSNNYYALYVQDDWKASSRLTLNLGLRYDLELGRDERFNQLSWFDFGATSPLAGRVPGFSDLRGGLRFLGVDADRQFDADANNFGPRFGLAYTLNPKTVVRAGYGVFYLPYVGAAAGGASGTEGFLTTTNWVASLDGLTPLNPLSNPFPDGLLVPTGSRLGLLTNVGQPLSGARTGALDRTTRNGYLQQWNFNVQRELPMRLTLEGAYTGSKGTKLPDEGWEENQLTREQMQLGPVLQQLVSNPFSGVIASGQLAQPQVTRAQLLRPYPHFLAVKNYKPGAASSIYHAFQARAQKQVSGGLSFLVSYTAGKLIDDSSGTTGTTAGSLSHQDAYNRRADRALANEDVSQRLVLSYVWDLPFGRNRRLGASWRGPANLVLGNWQVNGITTFSTGMPLQLSAPNTSGAFSEGLRPNVSGDPKLSGDRSTDEKLARWFNTGVFSQPAPFTFGNVSRALPNVRSDGIRNFDFSLFKVFPARERMRVELRAEFFNLFNTPQFAFPGTAFGAGAFGVVSGQANSPRQVQLGVKLRF